MLTFYKDKNVLERLCKGGLVGGPCKYNHPKRATKRFSPHYKDNFIFIIRRLTFGCPVVKDSKFSVLASLVQNNAQ